MGYSDILFFAIYFMLISSAIVFVATIVCYIIATHLIRKERKELAMVSKQERE